ncbi:hypothetical protein GCM10028805_62640 [Spirosoma harenae]
MVKWNVLHYLQSHCMDSENSIFGKSVIFGLSIPERPKSHSMVVTSTLSDILRSGTISIIFIVVLEVDTQSHLQVSKFIACYRQGAGW